MNAPIFNIGDTLPTPYYGDVTIIERYVSTKLDKYVYEIEIKTELKTTDGKETFTMFFTEEVLTNLKLCQK